MPLDDKPVESIDEGDLISLQQSGTPEGKQIEYKERLNVETPEDKRKLLKHVASFANASGGHLIYGIREDKGVPVEICGLELAGRRQDEIEELQTLSGTDSNLN